MKRFIDLRAVEDVPCRFAWWCTVVDQFEHFASSNAWGTWEDFEADYRETVPAAHQQVERYRNLTPDWAFRTPRAPEPTNAKG